MEVLDRTKEPRSLVPTRIAESTQNRFAIMRVDQLVPFHPLFCEFPLLWIQPPGRSACVWEQEGRCNGSDCGDGALQEQHPGVLKSVR